MEPSSSFSLSQLARSRRISNADSFGTGGWAQNPPSIRANLLYEASLEDLTTRKRVLGPRITTTLKELLLSDLEDQAANPEGSCPAHEFSESETTHPGDHPPSMHRIPKGLESRSTQFRRIRRAPVERSKAGRDTPPWPHFPGGLRPPARFRLGLSDSSRIS